MKNLSCSLALVLAAACGGDGGLTGDDMPTPDAAPDAPPGSMVINVPAGDLTGPITWEARNTYILQGYVFITGGKLTIEAGTVI